VVWSGVERRGVSRCGQRGFADVKRYVTRKEVSYAAQMNI